MFQRKIQERLTTSPILGQKLHNLRASFYGVIESAVQLFLFRFQLSNELFSFVKCLETFLNCSLKAMLQNLVLDTFCESFVASFGMVIIYLLGPLCDRVAACLIFGNSSGGRRCFEQRRDSLDVTV
jgi:hypothetical protein